MKNHLSLSLALLLAAGAMSHEASAHGTACAKPFQYAGNVYIPVNYSGYTGEFAVPAGYRLQIEYISAGFRMTTNDGRASFAVSTMVGGVTSWQKLPTEVGYALSDRMTTGPVTLYADANSWVRLSFNRASGYTVATTGTYTFTGCLYPA